MVYRGVAKVLMAALACSVLVVGGHFQTVKAASTTVTLPDHGFSRIVVDPATAQVFVSDRAAVTVLDLSGKVKKIITGELGSSAMAIVGGTLYVSLAGTGGAGAGSIDRIDTTSLAETSALVTGLTQPGDLAYAGGKLWTTTGACTGGSMKPVSIDLTAATPAATVYDNIFNGTNELAYCAKYATNHASNPSFILAWSWGLSTTTYDYVDVSTGAPVITKSTTGGATDVVVMADGAHFIDTSGAGCVTPPPVTYCFTEFNLSDLSVQGTNFPASYFPDAVDVTTAAAGGKPKIAGGVIQGLGGPQLVAYPLGDPSQLLASYPPDGFSPVDRGVAISPDGLTVYQGAVDSSCFPAACAELVLLPLPNLPDSGAPSPPTGVTATAGVGAASISWTIPIYHGTSAITGYTVTSSNGATKTVDASTFSTLMAGLSPDPHTFTVTANNASGGSDPSAPSNSVTPANGGTFNVLTPTRILDTRTGNGGFPIRRVPANTAISLQVLGREGVPADGVSAVVMNVTIAYPTGPGFLTAFPTGSTRPNVSNINYTAGVTIPNLVEVAVGAGGKVDLYVGGASAHVIADVEGWVGDATNSYFAQGLFNNAGPQRFYDSRFISTAMGYVHQPLGPGQSLTLQADRYPLPTGVSAVVMNVTVTAPSQAGYITVYPLGAPRPVASNLNFVAGQTIANRVIVAPGTNGNVVIFNGLGTVDVVVDMNGYFTGSFGTGQGSPYVTGDPYRIFDSRTCSGCKFTPGEVRVWQYPPGTPIIAVSLNVTATDETANGFLTVFPDVQPLGSAEPPTASDLNFTPGQTIANMTVVYVNQGDLAFDVFNGWGYTDVILDVDGFYGPAVTPLASSF